MPRSWRISFHLGGGVRQAQMLQGIQDAMNTGNKSMPGIARRFSRPAFLYT